MKNNDQDDKAKSMVMRVSERKGQVGTPLPRYMGIAILAGVLLLFVVVVPLGIYFESHLSDEARGRMSSGGILVIIGGLFVMFASRARK